MRQFKAKSHLYELRKLQTSFPKVKLVTSREASNFVRQFYEDDIEIFESFFILCLNQANNTIGFAKIISQGGITGTVVDVRLIAFYATHMLATSIIMLHNHPSGNKQPSDADTAITQKTKEGLKLLDIKVLDHIILTHDGFFSFADEGLL